MEDEDNENGLVDKWTLWEEAYYKEAGIDALAQINNSNVSLDDIDETREDCFYSSYPQESGGNGNSDVNLKNVIKGFKKNILKTQPEESQADLSNDNASVGQAAQTNDTSKEKTNEMVEVKEKNMAEYAQYLGLQPASSKSQCSKCRTLKSKTSAGESNQDECDCSVEESSQADADSSKLSLVNNVELPSTSSSKLPCTENSQLSILGNFEPLIINTLEPLCNNAELYHTNDFENSDRHCLVKTGINEVLFTDDPDLLPANGCNLQSADATMSPSAEANQSVLDSLSRSPSADISEVSCADRSQSPDAHVSKSLSVRTTESPSTEASQSPPAETPMLSPTEVSQLPAAEVVQSPSVEASQSQPADVPMSPPEEAFQLQSMEESQSPSVEASRSPSVEAFQSPSVEASQTQPADVPIPLSEETTESPSMEASQLPLGEAFQSPSMETCQSVEALQSPFAVSRPEEASESPFAGTFQSPCIGVSQSPSDDVCMSPGAEIHKSPLVDVSKSLPADLLMPPSAEVAGSPISNDLEFLSIGSPKLQPTGSESPASSCSQLPTINISESASCDSSELPPAESSQSPAQINMELSCDSNSKELQTDSSEVSSDKYEPIPSTSYEEPVPSTSYEQPIPSTSSCRSPSTKTLDSTKSSSGAQSTSQPSNFKITSKVYLCAACETYFENWNLFTHMREVHQRHICLFCLGMFGQAERLSHHLLKKHNVPDMNFNSAEEFFKVFIGPCYVVCCSCEKMFSETDNFHNHFCPPREAVQSTSGVCSQCKKINSHAEGCRLAPGTSDDKKVFKSLPKSSRTTKVEPKKANQTVTNVIRHSKRTIKPNRFNDDIYLYTKLTNIRTKRTKLQSTSENSDSACSDTHKDVCATESRELSRNSFSDTTVEEVNIGADNKNSFQNDRCAYSALENHDHTSESETLSRVSAKDTYDSVDETIMEVSQGTNDNDSVHTDEIPSSILKNTLDCSTSKGTVESSDPKDEDDVRLREKDATSGETNELNLEPNLFNNANENFNSDSESQASNSSSNPTDEIFNTNDKVPTPNPEKEQNKPVLSATPVTDRSLVIKICTKNNSVYSIKTPLHVENSNENHDSSRESEENNNSEESDKAPAAEESVKSLQDNYPDGEKMVVTENGENDDNLGRINFDSDVNKENKSDIDNQLDKNSETNCSSNDKPTLDIVDSKIENYDGIPLAGEEIAVVDLDVDDLLENMELEELLKRCIKAVCGICVYCNHARHIAVNGKQLSLHMLSEHRFQPQHPAIIINQEQFTIKVKKCFNELESYYFNLDSYNSKEGTYNVSTVKTYECFHCRFYSNSHKELYLHNRKMHQKPILICIMCKSTFLSYSELLCHLCPGVYAANVDIQYRCCLCKVSNIPSTFRLMVHLRKLHHACDVCLEITGNQQNLSNHVWKHKLHHLCYRCGIAYRNKPDITKHLFWKHGTESVLCKRCLQKKWPYIYHFCVPPAEFHCDECGYICSKAVALKVHKRIHSNEYPYSCSECLEKLISKKLLARHEKSHSEPEPPPPVVTPLNSNENQTVEEDVHVDVCNMEVKDNEAVEIKPETSPKEPVKKVVDVLDLPPLNLSDSDSDDEEPKPEECKSNKELDKMETDVVDKLETVPSETPITTEPINDVVIEIERNEKEKKQEEQIMDGIWDNFKSYTASLEKQEAMDVDSEKQAEEDARTKEETENLKKAILFDHDYCVVYPNKGEEGQSPSSISKKTDDNVETNKSNLPVERTPSPSATGKPQNADGESPKKKAKTPKKKKQNTSGSSSDSSSDSDSSNCSCGTGCSCSSSSSSGSSSSSSSSDSDSSSSDSPKKANREKRKKGKAAKPEEKNEVIAEVQAETKPETAETEDNVEIAPVEPPKPVVPVLVIRESDLETTESETDEEFYDKNPQQTASKLLAEKRKQMLLASGIPEAAAAPVNGVIDTDLSAQSGAAASPGQVDTPSIPAGKRKFKTRKRRKGLWGKARNPQKSVESIKLNIPKSSYQRRGAPRGRRHSTVSNVSSMSVFEANQMAIPGTPNFARAQSLGGSGSELDTTRSSKRKRVPKRFYDDSSDEENHMQRMLKWRRTDAPPIVNLPSPSSSKQSLQQQQQLLLQQHQQQQQLLIQQQQQLIMQQQQQQLIIQQQQQQLQFQQEQLLQAQRQQQQQQQHHHNEDEEDEEKALVIAASDSESNDSSSSDSSDSENETTETKNEVPAVPAPQPAMAASHSLFHSNFPQLHPIIPERSNNLYCYCQCPYDEVSEMIACDGDDCLIEWFHFECVGITVPPKGKWYCPDCRKNLGMSDEEMANG